MKRAEARELGMGMEKGTEAQGHKGEGRELNMDEQDGQDLEGREK